MIVTIPRSPARGGTDRSTTRRLILGGLLLFALLLRTYHLGYPCWDYFASRQTFNLMVVREYVRHGIDVFHPRLDWVVSADPSRPSYFAAELPWLHALAALQLRLLPFGDWSARLLPILFSLAGLWWLYRLARRGFGPAAAWFAALAWAVLPFSLFFGRVFMSDVPALSLAIGTVDLFCVWLATRRVSHLMTFAVLGSLAALTKPQVATFGLVLIFLGFLEFRGRLFRQWSLYLAASLMVLPAALSIHHGGRLFAAGGPDVIGAGMIGRSLGLWLKASTWYEQWNRAVHVMLGPVGLALTAAGFLWPARNPRQYLFHVWFLASALFLFLIPEAIVGWNDYYLLLLVPPAAGLIGIVLGRLYECEGTRSRAVLLGLALAISSMYSARSLFRSDGLHYRAGLVLNRLTAANDLVVTSTGGAPDTLYFAGRRGWEASRYDLSRLEELSAAGAKVFAMADPDVINNHRDLLPVLDHRFVRLSQDGSAGSRPGWIVWSLDGRDLHPHAAQTKPGDAASAVSFAGKIELQRASVSGLLRWPPSFAVRYNWHCLRTLDTDLRVFVHVTTPRGQSVFQQDHWPAAGHLPTTQWNVGDLIQERYILSLPEELPPGRYQLRAGWFDPARGPRLSIVSGASDGEERAIVAEFDVAAKPSPAFVNRWMPALTP